MSNQEKQVAQTKKTRKDESPQSATDQGSEHVIGPGVQLAKAREAMGWSQQEVADRLHLRITSVQAVEFDALEVGVSVTFTKGYVRLYAKLLNLEVEPLLLAHDKIHAKEIQPAKLQSFSRRVSREAHDHRWNMVSIVVVLLVLGSVVVWWVEREGYLKDSGKNISEAFDNILSSEDEENQDVQSDLSTITQSNAAKQVVSPPILDEDVLGLDDERADSSLANDIQNSEESAQALLADAVDEAQDTPDDAANLSEQALNEVMPDEAVTESTTQVSTGGRQVVPSRGDIVEGVFNDEGYRINSDGTVDVTFTFLKDCWVSVKDGNGETMAYGVKTKGRVMRVSGIPPVSVILGAPRAVAIDFGGFQVNMGVYPGGETARFSLPIESV